MSAGIYNFEIEQGATFTRTIVYQDSAGNPVNLTGYTARTQGRATYQSNAYLFSLTSSPAAGITITPLVGQIDITISATDTGNLPVGGVYDLEIVNGSVVTRLLQGSFTLSSEATR